MERSSHCSAPLTVMLDFRLQSQASRKHHRSSGGGWSSAIVLLLNACLKPTVNDGFSLQVRTLFALFLRPFNYVSIPSLLSERLLDVNNTAHPPICQYKKAYEYQVSHLFLCCLSYFGSFPPCINNVVKLDVH